MKGVRLMEIKSIKFGDFDIKPYNAFKEDDALLYIFNYKASHGEFEKFKEYVLENDSRSEKYFQVRINNDDFTMRFGIIGYSEHEEYYKIHVALVDQRVDEEEKPALYLHKEVQPNLIKDYVKQKIVIGKLIDTLKENKILTDEQVDEIFNVPTKEIRSNHLDLYKVDDVDDYEM